MLVLLFHVSFFSGLSDGFMGLDHGNLPVLTHTFQIKVPGRGSQGLGQELKPRTISGMIWRNGQSENRKNLLEVYKEIDPGFSADAFVNRWVRRGGEEQTLLKTVESLKVNSAEGFDQQILDWNRDTVIYYPGFGGTPFENAALFECLASHGFQVISLSHQGFYDFPAYPNATDLKSSVEDVQFILSHFNPEKLPRIFTMGHSWGGLVSQIVAIESPFVKGCIVLDGSQTASDFNGLAYEVVAEKRMKQFAKPLMAFLSAGFHHDLSFYSQKAFETTVLAKGFLVGHPHFTMNGVLFLEWAKSKEFDLTKLKSHPFIKAYRDQCEAILIFLNNPKLPDFGSIQDSEFSFTIKRGEEKLPSRVEFEFLLQDPKNISYCVEIYHRSHLIDPSNILFHEDLALSVGQAFLSSDLELEAKMIFGMVVHAYPTSAEANFSQGSYFEQMGMNEAAIRYYREAARLNPVNPKYLKAFSDLN